MTMKTETVRLLTVVAEAVLEDRLVTLVKKSGATGYTLTRVHGEGSRGVRASEWEGRNVKIETLVSDAVAERILETLTQKYFPHYAVVAYLQTVEVVRGGKYTSERSGSQEAPS